MGILDGATTLTSTIGNTLSNIGSATGISGVVNSVTGGLSALGSLFGGAASKTNVLHQYATYDYIIGFGVIPDSYLNDPAGTYMAGAPVPLICKSASVDPNNRIITAYGKYEFYIDNLQMRSLIGLDSGNNTNVMKMTFEVTEPYSMGLFIQSMQAAAQQQGHLNHRTAPYLITLEFRGNKENGMMSSIPGTKRYLSVMISDIRMSVDHMGSKYTVECFPFNQYALADTNALFKSDASAKGKTVQEVLQTGERSLQATINKRLKELEKQKKIEKADEVIILFPTGNSSGGAGDGNGAVESDAGATVDPAGASGGGDIFTKLGVSKSSKNETYVQGEGDCNEIGSAELGFDENRKADSPMSDDNKVWDDKNKVFVDGDNVADVKEGDFRFSQDTDIPNAINQVIFQSKFVKESLDPGKLSPEGYRDLWRIDTQVYNNGEINKATGEKPRIIVYRVVPYKVHASKTMPPNKQSPGFELLKGKAVREYNYIYTGKNVDIVKFAINIRNGFIQEMANDGFQKNQDIKTATQTGGDKPKEEDVLEPLPDGDQPQKDTYPTISLFTANSFSSDKRGGGGQETSATRAARAFYDSVTSGTDLMNIDVEIIGDPLYIVTGGQGNVAHPQGNQFAPDGSLNWQYQETDIKINFRTPLDINQATGLYNFGLLGSAPLLQYSGLYCLREVNSTFSQGKFTQKLTAWRRPMQEKLFPDSASDTLNTTNKPEVVDESPAE